MHPMPISIGMLIPPKLNSKGIEAVVTWAKAAGLTALDLPEDFAAPAEACRAQGLRLGAVSGTAQGGLLSPDEQKRGDSVTRLRTQIRAMPNSGAQALFLCLGPEERG